MMSTAIRMTIVLGCIGSAAIACGQTKAIGPPNPEMNAKAARVRQLEVEAEQLAAKGKIDDAATALREAMSIERTHPYPSFVTGAATLLARLFEQSGRDQEALDAYRNCFAWDSRIHDLDGGSGNAEDYALVLSKLGKVEEAKAMYYYALRHFNGGPTFNGGWRLDGDRSIEPVPFLVVFDPDPNAVVWEYTPERFRAAVLMLSQVGHADHKVIDEIRKLAPDWFWPAAYLADETDPASDVAGGPPWVARRAALIAEADRLAKPGLERELMAWYHELIKDRPSARHDVMPGTLDRRPMTEGNRRRALIEVLKPNEALLKKLSIPFPIPGTR